MRYQALTQEETRDIPASLFQRCFLGMSGCLILKQDAKDMQRRDGRSEKKRHPCEANIYPCPFASTIRFIPPYGKAICERQPTKRVA
jgi:hypothetical protein